MIASTPQLVSRRLLLVGLGFVVWFAAIAIRLGFLQVVRHGELLARAERQQQRVIQLDAPRGTIYDARGRELAVSVAVESAFAVPRDIPDKAAAASALAKLLGEPVRHLEARLSASREFVWVARKLDRPDAARLRDLAIPGIYFLEETKRYYPMRELGAHVLGYVGLDNLGLGGLELAYEKTIAGTSVRRTVLRDARQGTALDPELSFAEQARPGADLHLTLDATIQHIVERELARTVTEHKAKRGMVVVLDPRTGAVLALASWPTFDPNKFTSYDEASWRNRVIQDAYEPGSTFKVVTAAAALEHGLVSADDHFDCQMGAITLAGIRIGDHKPFGVLSLRDVLAKSSNVGAVKLGLTVGTERLHEMIRRFGFGQPTGLDLPGESAGIVRPAARWQPLSKAYISFGQEISITPLQLATALAVVANGGQLLAPHVVAARSDGRGGVTNLHRSPRVLGSPISMTTARTLERMLEAVVTDGTAKAAAIPGFSVAGKTGTAQKADARGYSATRFVASFAGFAPASDAKLLAAVVIDEPHPFIHGGEVAAPAFARIVGETLLYLGHAPQREPLELWPLELPAVDDVAGMQLLASLATEQTAPRPALTQAELDADAEGPGTAIASQLAIAHELSLTAPEPSAPAAPGADREAAGDSSLVTTSAPLSPSNHAGEGRRP